MDPITADVEDVDSRPVRLRTLDAETFVTAAYESHKTEVYEFIARACRDPSAAEDLLQETFLRLISEARAGRSPDHLRAWLFRVASNLVISRGRRRATALSWLRRYGPSEHGSDLVRSAEARAVQSEQTRDMDRALARLPPEARLALVLSTLGFSGTEIAASIGRSELATRTLLSRARVRVRAYLAEEDAR